MDNQKVAKIKKELEEKERQERERKKELEDKERWDKENKQKIKIAQLTTIHNDITSYENMISKKKMK